MAGHYPALARSARLPFHARLPVKGSVLEFVNSTDAAMRREPCRAGVEAAEKAQQQDQANPLAGSAPMPATGSLAVPR